MMDAIDDKVIKRIEEKAVLWHYAVQGI